MAENTVNNNIDKILLSNQECSLAPDTEKYTLYNSNNLPWPYGLRVKNRFFLNQTTHIST